ncbi:hypothetical protein BJX70DRAFT_410587 [Aspergillus crustosus]
MRFTAVILLVVLQLVHFLAKRGGPPVDILVSPDEHQGVAAAAKDLALDFGRVVHQNPTLSRHERGVFVIAGTIGSSLVDKLGQWESYVQAVVHNPLPGISHALVIAGNDKRGAIYCIYDISETIGVSPWYYWAGVPAKTKDAIYLNPNQNRVQGSPSVRYRGIFINDEWELFAWTDDRFPKSPLGDHFTSDFYALVFELLLRLKANYLWPGMKENKSFYLDDPKNGALAHEYGIVMGTRHHEPLTRSYYEQGLLDGNWDWSLNKDEVKQFMEEGVNRSTEWETLYTMGMRGDGDTESPTLDPAQLEEIIEYQQDLIEDLVPRPLEEVGQMWSLYSEVGKYWQAGMNISDLVTLMWTDDNFGNLLRVPLGYETTRTRGAGVYYHLGYVGDPHSYEWINTNQLIKVWEQMHFAYEREAREIWIANCNYIKALEVPTTLFLDMAYDMKSFQTPDSPTRWLKQWAQREFGLGVEDATAQIINTYGQLVLRQNILNYDEASKVLQDWKDLLALAQKTYDSLDPSIQGNYFQLVLHPVPAGKTMTELYITKHLGDLYGAQLRTSTNVLAQKTQQAFANDAAITNRYHALFNGKWDCIMSGKHIGYTSRNFPSRNIIPNLTWISDEDVLDVDILDVAVQGFMGSSNSSTPITLLPTNASYISVSSQNGTLTAPGLNSDVRSVITVNWNKAPAGLSWLSFTVTNLETNNIVTALLPPVHYTTADSRSSVSHTTLPFYGRTHSGLKLWPVNSPSQSVQTGPKLTYFFYSFSQTKARLILFLGGTLDLDPTRPPRVAFSVDSGEVVTKRVFPDYEAGKLSRDWDTAVIRGGWNVTADLDFGGKNRGGEHSLNPWLLEPGVVAQKILIDFDGLKESALGPPESYRVERR